MKNTGRYLAAALALGVAGLAPAVAAQEKTKPLGVFKDWNAQTYVEKGKLVCTMWTEPSSSEGNYTKRGAVYAFVTHRPSFNRADEVSINIGYPFKQGSSVNVTIGGARFELFTDGQTAWTRTSKQDRILTRAMRAGAVMAVSAISKFGTETTDTFSLSGFSAAYNAITRACKVR